MGKTTNNELVEVLTSRNVDGKYDKIIERAKKNGYHDFKFDQNPEYEETICPKIDLVEDLSKFPELEDVRNDVMSGVYDESPDAEDAEMIKSFFQ